MSGRYIDVLGIMFLKLASHIFVCDPESEKKKAEKLALASLPLKIRYQLDRRTLRNHFSIIFRLECNVGRTPKGSYSLRGVLGTTWPRTLPRTFSKPLLRVPCIGLGPLTEKKKAYNTTTEENLLENFSGSETSQ